MKKYDKRTLIIIHSWLGEPSTNQWEVRGRISALIEDDRAEDLNEKIEELQKQLDKTNNQ